MGTLLQLIIRDDGKGFNETDSSVKQGIGLRNMRERVEFIGGELEISSEPHFGTEITVLLNLDGLMVWKSR
jgi:two-component system NarL family sensor kinase